MNIKGTVFDFDGTLFDSMQIWENVGIIYLGELGKEPKETLREELRTLSLQQSADFFKEEYVINLTTKEIIDGINKIIEKYYLYEVQPKEGVVEFLDRLQAAQVKMCIATATDRYLIEAALKRCNLDKYFSKIFTCSEIGYGKDKPQIFRCAMDYLGLNRQTTIIFEDAYHAIVTAKKDGFLVAGVADASERRQEEIRKMTDCYVADFRDIHTYWNDILLL